MAAAAFLLLACAAAPCLPGRASIPAASLSSKTKSGSCGRAPGVRRNTAAKTYITSSGKYIAPDYLVKKVTTKELEELVREERKVPLIVDFDATWCGPCVLMAQDIEMGR